MFGGARAIWIDAQARDLLPALEPLFARPPRDCAIVVKAGQLRKGTGLRAAFETSAIRASIECYSDDANALEALIDAEARAAGLAIAPDARAALVALTGADRQTTRGRNRQADALCAGKTRHHRRGRRGDRIRRRAVQSRRGRSIRRCSATCRAVETALTRFFHDGGEADHLMMRLVARLLLLHRLRLEMDQGRPFDAACQALFVKLPMPARRALGEAGRAVDLGVHRPAPASGSSSERARSRRPRLAEVLATRALWTLASRGRGGR